MVDRGQTNSHTFKQTDRDRHKSQQGQSQGLAKNLQTIPFKFFGPPSTIVNNF